MLKKHNYTFVYNSLVLIDCKQKLKNKSNEDKLKFIYDWVQKKYITLYEFKDLISHLTT